MASQERTDKVVRVNGMSVAGGDLSLPKGEKYFVNLELDYSKVSFEEAIELASGGSSVRVQAQAKLRGDEATLEKHGIVAEDLASAEKKGLAGMEAIRFDVSTDFESEGRKSADPAKQAQKAVGKMTAEQKFAFLIGMGIDEATARATAYGE